MTADDGLMKKIRDAIESIDYGSVRIILSEKGNYIEIITEKCSRIYKDVEYHKG
jgi:hypothetical protein